MVVRKENILKDEIYNINGVDVDSRQQPLEVVLTKDGKLCL
jgi:hypothetical protein